MKRSILIISACFVVGLVSGCIIHGEKIKRDLQREFATRCPPGFVEWENRRYLPMDKVDGNGDTLRFAEKHFFKGCYLFRPSGAKDSAYTDTVYETTTISLFNLRTARLLDADTVLTKRVKNFK